MKWKRRHRISTRSRTAAASPAVGADSAAPSGAGPVVAAGLPIPIPGGKAGGGHRQHHRRGRPVPLISGVLGGGGSGIPRSAGSAAAAARPGGTLDPQGDTDQQLAYIVSEHPGVLDADVRGGGPRLPGRSKLVLFDGSTQSACGPASACDRTVLLPSGPEGLPGPRLLRRAAVALRGRGRRLRDRLRRRPRVRAPRPDRDSASRRRSRSVSQQDPGQRERPVGQAGAAGRLPGRRLGAFLQAADLEAGDIDEALSAAAAVGDDRIQQSTTGRIDPEELDPRLGRAAGPVVHHRVPERRQRRLRHLRPVASRAQSG